MKMFKLNQRELGDEHEARNAIKPGMTLYGYCGGLFGRNSYGDKLVIAVHNEYVEVEENGVLYSGCIDGDTHTWAGLIEDSNEGLASQERDKEYYGK